MTLAGWSKTVVVQIRPRSGFIPVSNTRTAFDLLISRWPVTSGKAFWAAQEICLAAMDRRVPHEDARLAFIAAATEANIAMD